MSAAAERPEFARRRALMFVQSVGPTSKAAVITSGNAAIGITSHGSDLPKSFWTGACILVVPQRNSASAPT